MRPYFTPILLPNIVPDSWNSFWNIWNSTADQVLKFKHPHDAESRLKVGDTTTWKGMEIYDPSAGTNKSKSVSMPIIDIRESLPKMFGTLMSLKPFFKNFSITMIQSVTAIGAHTDRNLDSWMVRCFFHYPAANEQWYFTRPNDHMGERTYIQMPQDTTWFAFNDKNSWHGTDYDMQYPKILIKIYGSLRDQVLQENFARYKNYVLSF